MSIRSTDPSWLSWFFNHWPEILLTDFLRYAIPAGMLAVILVLCADRLAKRRIQSTPRSTTDLIRELTHSASTVLIFSMVGLAIAASEQMGWMRILFGSDQVLWQAANLVVMILLHDAYFYWSHRAMHHKRLFKWVHRTHHLSRQPGPFTAYSFAPLEAVVEALFLPLYLLVVPTHAIVIALFLVHMVLRNVIAHAGVELFPAKWMAWPILRHFTVTSHHDMHHAHFNCNYGFYFTWWDRWMGTEHPEYVSRFEHLTQAGTQPVRKGRETQVGKVGLLAVIAGATLLSADLDAQTQQKTAAPAPCPVDGL